MSSPLSDRENLKVAEAGLVGSTGMVGTPNQTAAYSVVKEAHTKTYCAVINDAATAGTAVTETVFAAVRNASRFKSMRFNAPVGITASDTLFATITLSKRTSAGITPIVLATFTTKVTGGSGTLVAFQTVTTGPAATAVDLAAGDLLTVAVTKASTGTALTAATSLAYLSVDMEEI